MLNIKGISYLFLCCFALSSSIFAYAPTPTHKHNYKGERGHYKGESLYKEAAIVPSQDHFEGIGALGIAKLNAGNSQLGVTSSETDTLVQTNQNAWNTFGAQLGAGYIHYLHSSLQYADYTQWFPSIEPELNFYYLASNSIDGNVWRFGSSNFNQMTYDIPLHSTRLMLDAALTVASYKRFGIYAKGGIGSAWNRLDYNDTDNGGTTCANQRLSLNSNTNWNFAWEAGLGLTFALNDRVGLSLEYLYTDLGKVKTASGGNTGTITAPVIVPTRFSLNTQTALLGLHIAL